VSFRTARALDARRTPPFVNLTGDYRWLRAGYWALVDAELNGVPAKPSPVQAVTVQNAAACLLVARRHGIATPAWHIAKHAHDITPPVLLMPVSGMTDATYACHHPRSRQSQWRRATQNGTRPTLSVAFHGKLRSFKLVMGMTTREEDHELAWRLWAIFGVPLARVWVIEPDQNEDESSAADGAQETTFLGLDPLPLHELTPRDLRLLEEVSQRPMSRS